MRRASRRAIILKRPPAGGGGGGGGALPTIAALTAGPFTHAMAFLDGQVSSSQGVQLGSVTTQTNILSSYASGCVKHALVSWVIPSAGNYVVTAITNPGGSFSPTNPSASVAFTIGGTTYTATLPAFNSANTRVNGAVMRESRYIVIPANGGTPHAFLVVVFDIRSYAAGGHRVDIAVGTTRDNSSVDRVTYNVVVTINGSTSYSRTSMEHGSFMRWRHVGYVSLVEGAITHDTSALETLKVVPTYLSSTWVGNTYNFTQNIDGLSDGGRGYDKLRTGIISPNFGDTGGREDIGLFPRWQALYLRHKAANTLEATTRHGDLFGSWSVHISEDSGDPEALKNIDTYPNWWTGGSPGTTTGPINGYAGYGMTTCAQNPDRSHQPNAVVLPWLLTGDRYYADELAFWADWNVLAQPPPSAPNCRNGSEGLLAGDQQRGWAWGCRTIGFAGKWLPDAHPFKSYFADKAQNNMDWANDFSMLWYVNGLGGVPHPLGFAGVPAADQSGVFMQGNTDGIAGKDAILTAAGYSNVSQLIIFGPWQYCFMSTVMLSLHHLGYTGSMTMLDSLVGVIRNLFTHDPDIPFNHAMMIWPPCAYNTTLNTTVMLDSWFKIHDLSSIVRGDLYPSESDGGCPPFTVYGAFGRAALMIGKGRGASNDSIISSLMAYVHPVSGQTMVDNVNNQPEWAYTQTFLNY